MAFPKNLYGFIALTGGGQGALDKIDGADLDDQDFAMGVVSGVVHQYWLDIDSGAAENSPYVIAPDTNAGDKRWILASIGKLTGDLDANNYSINNVFGRLFLSQSLADETQITMPTGVTGWGFAQAGDNEEWIQFTFTATGVVTIISNSANAVNTDTDGNLCVYDVGAGIAIKNRLGATKTIKYRVSYP